MHSYDPIQRSSPHDHAHRRLMSALSASHGHQPRQGAAQFADSLLAHLKVLLGQPAHGLVAVDDASEGIKVVATLGALSPMQDCVLDQVPDGRLRSWLAQAFRRADHHFGGDHVVLYFGADRQRLAVLLLIDQPLEPHEQHLLGIFCRYVGLANDNVQLVSRLHQLSYIDPLCELPNRTSFIEAIEHTLRAGPAGRAVVTIDVDHFGATSQTIGYLEANRLLVQIAKRLREHLPPQVHIARVAGDAFGILGDMADLGPERLAAVFEDPIELGCLTLNVSVTSGRVALSTLHNCHGEDIIRSAFFALKRAKEQRRGSDHEFTPALAEAFKERTLMLHDLRQALRDQEFSLAFQPQIDLTSNRPIGVEALIRWRRRNGEFVPPNRFIEVAEHSGIIGPLGDFVMDRALRQLATLRTQGYTRFRMAINVSMMQWLDRSFPDRVESLLQAYQLPAAAVELEITETIAMQGAEPVLEVMQRIRELGLQMALDDFGTGFSSLSYLKLLPVHSLKIDRAFVADMEQSPRNQALAETVVRLGHNLDLKIIAEGVENVTQAGLLRAIGCHEAQGYYFARPMPGSELAPWLAQYPH